MNMMNAKHFAFLPTLIKPIRPQNLNQTGMTVYDLLFSSLHFSTFGFVKIFLL
jgi:hypothetical protein